MYTRDISIHHVMLHYPIDINDAHYHHFQVLETSSIARHQGHRSQLREIVSMYS
jgi:hypothetical protein